MKAYIIACGTGCTCCSSENHYRGFYHTKEDAERRIAYYLSPESKFWPLSSQYARRGCYSAEEVDLEAISGDRYILNGEKLVHSLVFIEVNADGTISEQADEYLFSDLF
jgi:hypothetical protein